MCWMRAEEQVASMHSAICASQKAAENREVSEPISSRRHQAITSPLLHSK